MKNIFFILDTFSWKKVEILEKAKIFDLENLYKNVNLCTTHEIYKEVEHFRLASCHLSKLVIFPIQKNQLYENAKILKFDEADASLVSNLYEKDTYYGITEDRPLLAFGKSHNLKIMQLIDFCRILSASDLLSPKNLYQINKKLRELRNISERKEKEIKIWFQTKSEN